MGAAISAVLPGAAEAANGDNLVAGQVKTATNETGVKKPDAIGIGTPSQYGSFFGVYFGVDAFLEGSVYGYTRSHTLDPNGQYMRSVGVLGVAEGAYETNIGVLGDGHTGVRGQGAGDQSTGVLGVGNKIGVKAKSGGGRALDVRGKAYFSTAGKGTIAAGTSKKTITGAVLDTNASILVTLQGPAGQGVYMSHAKKIDATFFRVVLNKPATVNTPFAWFIVN